MFKLDDYDYSIPEEQIAQEPIKKRDESKLMVLNRENKEIEISIFKDIIKYIDKGDLIITNNTKVIPARIIGYRSTGAKIEVFLLSKTNGENTWKVLVKPGRKAKIGDNIIFSNNLKGQIINLGDEGTREIKFFGENIWKEIKMIGKVPLPPYINKELDDENRYQTTYAKHEGAVAAPTAGLHFTNELINKLKYKGVNFGEITLHVGLGTFRPIKTKDIREHKMHEEYYSISEELIKLINETKKRKHKIIAVGTTVVRALESYAKNNKLEGNTDIFIYPPYKFSLVDGLITNFHLPKSTLLVLVSAFSDKDLILEAYKKAVNNKFRFFSFGDAMFIK